MPGKHPTTRKRNSLRVGQEFDRLTVIGPPIETIGVTKYRATYYVCRCKCGEVVASEYRSLTRGMARSCGCLQRETAAEMNRTHGSTAAAAQRNRLHMAWGNMKARCFYRRGPEYHNYGGRGITVCPEWADSFPAFRDWALANGYEDGLSLDRMDPDGHYEPSNCRWIPKADQARTMRKCRHLAAFGETKTAREWARDPRCLVSYNALLYRLKSGWSHEAAISTPPADKWGNPLPVRDGASPTS